MAELRASYAELANESSCILISPKFLVSCLLNSPCFMTWDYVQFSHTQFGTVTLDSVMINCFALIFFHLQSFNLTQAHFLGFLQLTQVIYGRLKSFEETSRLGNLLTWS